MYSRMGCAVATIDDAASVPGLIDDILRGCWVESMPVYIRLPTDMILTEIDGERLLTRIDCSIPENDAEKEGYAVDAILQQIYAARAPVILVDAGARHHQTVDEVHELLRKTSLPVFVTPMGKGTVPESLDTFGGVYAGHASYPEVEECVESADLILSIGSLRASRSYEEMSGLSC